MKIAFHLGMHRPALKSCSTTTGEILEVFTYYEALKKGYFDELLNVKREQGWNKISTTNC